MSNSKCLVSTVRSWPWTCFSLTYFNSACLFPLDNATCSIYYSVIFLFFLLFLNYNMLFLQLVGFVFTNLFSKVFWCLIFYLGTALRKSIFSFYCLLYQHTIGNRPEICLGSMEFSTDYLHMANKSLMKAICMLLLKYHFRNDKFFPPVTYGLETLWTISSLLVLNEWRNAILGWGKEEGRKREGKKELGNTKWCDVLN